LEKGRGGGVKLNRKVGVELGIKDNEKRSYKSQLESRLKKSGEGGLGNRVEKWA
jgi:hypothetical protein